MLFSNQHKLTWNVNASNDTGRDAFEGTEPEATQNTTDAASNASTSTVFNRYPLRIFSFLPTRPVEHSNRWSATNTLSRKYDNTNNGIVQGSDSVKLYC
mmetsp:Transcript_7987/g.10985  ORF Transcript_7987/g.10985 Transcript_7987/m.10985 type:complete len:99 (-) Transcript_7987:15-311(-)